MALRRKRSSTAPATGPTAAATARGFDDLVLIVAGAATGPMSAFSERREVLGAADHRCWQLALDDPALARRLRRVLLPESPATPEARAAYRLASRFRVAEKIAADFAKEQPR